MTERNAVGDGCCASPSGEPAAKFEWAGGGRVVIAEADALVQLLRAI